MTRDDLATRLLATLARVQAAEQALLDASEDLMGSRFTLQAAEDAVFLAPAGYIDGKNAETRAAQLRSLTEHEAAQVAQDELVERRARTALVMDKEELSVFQSLTRLIGGGE
jgi:hypothetical protein